MGINRKSAYYRHRAGKSSTVYSQARLESGICRQIRVSRAEDHRIPPAVCSASGQFGVATLFAEPDEGFLTAYWLIHHWNATAMNERRERRFSQQMKVAHDSFITARRRIVSRRRSRTPCPKRNSAARSPVRGHGGRRERLQTASESRGRDTVVNLDCVHKLSRGCLSKNRINGKETPIGEQSTWYTRGLGLCYSDFAGG